MSTAPSIASQLILELALMPLSCARTRTWLTRLRTDVPDTQHGSVLRAACQARPEFAGLLFGKLSAA